MYPPLILQIPKGLFFLKLFGFEISKEHNLTPLLCLLFYFLGLFGRHGWLG
jgi:hypothetical protein